MSYPKDKKTKWGIIMKSTRKNKKYMLIVKSSTKSKTNIIHFGAADYEQYHDSALKIYEKKDINFLLLQN